MANPLDKLQDFSRTPLGQLLIGPQNATYLATTPQPIIQAQLIGAASVLGGPVYGPFAAAATAIVLPRLIR